MRKRSTNKRNDDLQPECGLSHLKGGVRGQYCESSTAGARLRPTAMGSVPGLNYDNISELLEQLEGPMHR